MSWVVGEVFFFTSVFGDSWGLNKVIGNNLKFLDIFHEPPPPEPTAIAQLPKNNSYHLL